MLRVEGDPWHVPGGAGGPWDRVLDAQRSCGAALLELPASHNMVLITCSLLFYKLQIRINCFMESL